MHVHSALQAWCALFQVSSVDKLSVSQCFCHVIFLADKDNTCRFAPVHDTSVCTDLAIRPENENHRMIWLENRKALNNGDSFTDVVCRWWETWTSVYPGYVMSLGYTWPRRNRNLTSAHSCGWCVDASLGTSQVTLGVFCSTFSQGPNTLGQKHHLLNLIIIAFFWTLYVFGWLCFCVGPCSGILNQNKIQTQERFKGTLNLT